MNIVRTGVRSVWKRSWTFLGVKLQHFGSERVMLDGTRCGANLTNAMHVRMASEKYQKYFRERLFRRASQKYFLVTKGLLRSTSEM